VKCNDAVGAATDQGVVARRDWYAVAFSSLYVMYGGSGICPHCLRMRLMGVVLCTILPDFVSSVIVNCISFHSMVEPI